MEWIARFEPGELTPQVVDDLLWVLFRRDCAWLARNLWAPELYRSGVRYELEPIERWRAWPIILRERRGDCECLCCARASELVIRHGIGARPVAQRLKSPESEPRYHVLVCWPDGQLEDPSRVLGMKG